MSCNSMTRLNIFFIGDDGCPCQFSLEVLEPNVKALLIAAYQTGSEAPLEAQLLCRSATTGGGGDGSILRICTDIEGVGVLFEYKDRVTSPVSPNGSRSLIGGDVLLVQPENIPIDPSRPVFLLLTQPEGSSELELKVVIPIGFFTSCAVEKDNGKETYEVTEDTDQCSTLDEGSPSYESICLVKLGKTTYKELMESVLFSLDIPAQCTSLSDSFSFSNSICGPPVVHDMHLPITYLPIENTLFLINITTKDKFASTFNNPVLSTDPYDIPVMSSGVTDDDWDHRDKWRLSKGYMARIISLAADYRSNLQLLKAITLLKDVFRILGDAHLTSSKALTHRISNLSTISHIYYITGNYRKSLEYMEQAASLEEGMSVLLEEQLGIISFELKDYPKALKHYKRTFEMALNQKYKENELVTPTKMETVKVLIGACLLMMDGEHVTKGIQMIQNSAPRNGSNDISTYWMTRCYVKRDQGRAAVTWGLELLMRHPDENWYRENFAFVMGNIDNSVELLRNILPFAVETSELYRVCGLVCRDYGLCRIGILLLSDSIRSNPTDLYKIVELMQLYETLCEPYSSLKICMNFLDTMKTLRLDAVRSDGVRTYSAPMSLLINIVERARRLDVDNQPSLMVHPYSSYPSDHNYGPHVTSPTDSSAMNKKKNKKSKNKKSTATLSKSSDNTFEVNCASGAGTIVEPSGGLFPDAIYSDPPDLAEGLKRLMQPRNDYRINTEQDTSEVGDDLSAIPPGSFSTWVESEDPTYNYATSDIGVLGTICVAIRCLYVSGHLHGLPDLINQLHHFIRKGVNLCRRRIANQAAFFSLCGMLLQYIPQYNRMPEKDLPTVSVYIMGDSHVLPLAHQTHTLEGKRTLLIPVMITGLKIWHLRDASKFPAKKQFETLLQRVNPFSDLVLILGEIDCREGIIKAVERAKYENLTEAMDALADVYISRIKAIARGRQGRLFIHYPPAALDFTRAVVLQFWSVLDIKLEELYRDPSVLVFPLRIGWTLEDGNTRLKDEYFFDRVHMSPAYVPQLIREMEEIVKTRG